MKELIILGRGPSWKGCPFDAECWAIASVLGMSWMKDKSKIHKVFAQDDDGDTRRYLKIARKHHIPVVSTRDYATEPFPLDEILKVYPNYLRTSVSYALAYAVYKGYEKIRLYGIDQGPEWDHLMNKPFTMFWLGVASGKGISWTLPPYSILLETFGAEIKEYVLSLKAKLIETGVFKK